MPERRSSLLAAVALALAVVFGCDPGGPSPGSAPDVEVSAAPVESMEDPRLARLLDAADAWRAARGPERAVVDQVVLVPDVPSFFAALAAWDGRSFFPILIDDPRWTIPFLRAFRPSWVVRPPATPRRYGDGPFDEWGAAGDAVSRAWIDDDPASMDLPPSGARPRGMGPTPPGLVLSHPGSPSLAGAAALAAGRFQPLVRVGRVVVEGSRDEPLGFDATLSEEQAVVFARRVEARVATVVGGRGGLGDDADFLTLAGEWPFRYEVRRARGMNQGPRAVDDLIGRVLERGEAELDDARTRWAFTGRLLGDAPASVYRAMSALFLQPESALLWNTYGGGFPWSDYDMDGAAMMLRLIRPGAVAARAGSLADLASWREATRAPDGRDLLMINSSGGPSWFSIAGGPATPGDVPFGASGVVSMIHSFSAADPTDPDTIAGRFLDRGSFVYFGSMNEPYLTSFRAPYIASRLMAAEVPLAAALRQGPGEAYGFPWKLAYLGDPLYRLDPDPASRRPARLAPGPLPPGASALSARPDPDAPDAAGTLDWCYDATLLAAATFGVAATPEVLDALDELDRDALDRGRRAKLDLLLIDRSIAAGDIGGLLGRLERVPAAERSPTVWRAIETAALGELAAALREDRFDDAVNLWRRVVSEPWGLTTNLPGELTRRLVDATPPDRIAELRRRLAEARDGLGPSNSLAGRREMLEEAARKLDKKLAN